MVKECLARSGHKWDRNTGEKITPLYPQPQYSQALLVLHSKAKRWGNLGYQSVNKRRSYGVVQRQPSDVCQREGSWRGGNVLRFTHQSITHTLNHPFTPSFTLSISLPLYLPCIPPPSHSDINHSFNHSFHLPIHSLTLSLRRIFKLIHCLIVFLSHSVPHHH